ncbi:hypothetical protein [Synechococcus sp. M16CYN]|uniref:hypothetical protein n=1 Tax=Synechococcus sp. M16CYN TaxID=3103139 RepID=UPI0032477817
MPRLVFIVVSVGANEVSPIGRCTAAGDGNFNGRQTKATVALELGSRCWKTIKLEWIRVEVATKAKAVS